MHRTEGLNYGTDLSGNNVFKETPLPPSTVGADWLNAVQEEIANAIVASGQALETAATDTAHMQLATAIAASQSVYSEMVLSQLTFNSIWERTAANAYKVKDAITSLLIKPLSGGYFLTGATSPLSGGDTWGVFTLNKVMNMVCENESLIVFGNDNGKMVFPASNGSFVNVILWRPVGAQELVQVTGTGSSFMPVRKFYGSPVSSSYSYVSLGGTATTAGSTAIGVSAVASGTSATAIGTHADATNTNAVAIGDNATATGVSAVSAGYSADATGELSVAIGGNSAASAQYAMALGDDTLASAVGSSAIGNAAQSTEVDVMKLGNVGTTVKTQSAIVVISDERDKAEITDNDAGLAFINRIKTKKYRMNPREAHFMRDEKGKFVKDEDGNILYDKDAHKQKTKIGKRWHRGVIAQDIANDFDTNDFAIVKDSQINSPGSFDQMGVDYQEFIPILIKAVQELSAKIDKLEGKK